MNAEIQIQFPQPSERDKFTLTAIYQDADSYTHTDRYTQDDIPADQAPAMSAVVAALVGLAEPWQAAQVWARLGDIPSPSSPTDKVPAVLLTVEATGDSGVQKYLPLTNIPSSYSPIVVHYPSLTSSQKDDNHELTRTS